jgi:hypothetical protein
MLADFNELGMHAFFQLLTLLQRPAGVAGALSVAAYQLIRVQLRRITWQEMKCQLALLAHHILLDHGLFVRRLRAMVSCIEVALLFGTGETPALSVSTTSESLPECTAGVADSVVRSLSLRCH